ncbi:MAG: FAD-dependent oxidoreductase [Chthoniobacterales bacterium]|nr:FAD-dependent oxidoreductase [Chthoniobacterales bacterium]
MAEHQHQTERAGDKISLWEATTEAGALNPLRENIRTDVCIVGAGISGLTTAYTLVRAGKKVVVLDDGLVGRGMTGRTTAHIVNALDDRYYEIEKLHGEEGSRMAAESHTAAIDRVEENVTAERIDCQFERLDGYLFEPPNEPIDNLNEEFEACLRAGLDVELVNRAPMEGLDSGPAIKFKNQAQFHPLHYLRGLAAAIERYGGKIFTGTRVVDVQESDNGVAKTKDGFTIEAQSFVVATNTPINDRYVIHTKQAPYTTYVIGLRVPKGSVTRALFWDTAQHAGEEDQAIGMVPYHYVRVAEDENGNEVLVVGGEDHKTGQADDFEQRYQRLEDWTRVRWPNAGEVVFRWSGQVMEPEDMMGFIGRNPSDKDNVYIATGDSGNGMTHGTIAGILIPDLILGRENRWAKLYDPSRLSFKSAGDFLKENINVAAQYRDYVTGGDVRSRQEIAPGQGAVLRRGLKKLACYRDDSGTLHEMTAICPHLKCIVHWNRNEKTWDCPCHGSRFDAMGHVLNGPSVADLAPVAADASTA